METGRPARTDQLLDHGEWMRGLARHLAGEEGEDVAQEAWLAAQRSPPDPSRPVRPWLAQVLRNLVRTHRRNDARRSRREHDYVGHEPESALPLDEVHERAELERFLTERVMALEESLRTVVLLRYFEGLDSARISALTGVPAGTVRWRLKVALDRLRVSLDERQGGKRQAWVVLLAPARRIGPGMPAGATGSLLAIGLAVAVAFGSGAFLWTRGARPARPASTVARSGRASTARPTAAAPGTMAGRVVDDGGRPVEGAVVLASVTLEDLAALRPPTGDPARTGADGRFVLPGLEAGRYLLTATRAGLGFAHSEVIALGAGQSLRDLALTLIRTSAGLSGRVVDSGGGAIGGARVLARLLERAPPVTFATVSDEEGRYRLELPLGNYAFLSEAEGYAAARYGLFLHIPMVRDFRLEPASRISGRVVAAGGPVAGAEVHALPVSPGEDNGGGVTFTGEDGAFSFVDLDPGTYRLLARRGGLVGGGAEVAVTLAQEQAGLTLSLGTGRTASGQVLGASGVPLAGAQVTTLEDAAPATVTGADGRYTLQGLEPGVAYVAATAAGYSPVRQRVDLGAGDVTGVTLALAAEASVTGRVVDEGGRPVPGAHLSVSVRSEAGDRGGTVGRGDDSDGQGRFRLDRLAPGALRITVTHGPGIADLGPLPIAAGETRQVEIVLSAGAEVTGLIRREDGSPAGGAHVYANVDGWQPTPAAAAVAGPDGRYRLSALHPGDVMIRAVEPGNDPFPGFASRQPRADQAPLVLRSGEQRSGVDLTVLRNDLSIRGRVVDAEGHAVAGAVIRAAANGVLADPGYGRTLSGDDGQLAIEGLSRGIYTISVTHPDFAEQRRDGLAAGASGLEVRLERAGALGGRVIGLEGEPVPEFAMTARPIVGAAPSEWELWRHWAGGEGRQLVYRPDGEFLFPRLAPGTYDLQAQIPGGLVATLARVSVGAGERRDGLRVLAHRAVALRGRVIDQLTGQPIARARVEGRGMAAGQLAVTADAGGAFVLGGLPGGEEVEFAVMGPTTDYLNDAQHRTTPVSGAAELGDIPLFPGPRQKLTQLGPGSTGLSIHSRDGHPVVFAVHPGGPGARAGVSGGEAVLAVDGRDVRALSGSVVEGMLASGDGPVRLRLRAGEEVREVTVTR
jgi:RNA polymerase sigma factor (sigma-70 family)